MDIFVVRILIFSIFIVTEISARVYTLDKLLEVAIQNSKQLKTVEWEMRKADAQVEEVVGNGMPQISASVNLSHSNASMDLDQDRLQNTLQNLLNDPGIDNTEEAGLIISKSAAFSGEMMKTPDNTMGFSLDIRQVVFAQGKVRLGVKIAKAYQRTLLCKYNHEKMKLKSVITASYYNALLAQQRVKISSDAVLLSEQTHRLAVVTHLVGRASELDTLTSLLHLQKAKIELQKALSFQRMAYETIINQSGIDEVCSDFSVEGNLDETEFSLSLEQVLEMMKEKNPDIEQLRGKKEIQNLQVQIIRTDFYPTVQAGATLSGFGTFDGAKELNNPNLGHDRKVYIGLNWNIFTGLSRIQRLHQAEADKAMFQLSERQLVENFELQTRNAYEQVILNRNNLLQSKSLIRLAEKGYSVAKKAYEVGSKTLLDVQNAEFELNNSKISLSEALFYYQCAIVSLRLLMGDI